ncbi:MAG: hypothetical protein EBU62_01795, partial [Proteobacteria bacterium]|nr:hypothetical protein [Pseudomonadota bacterium]
ETGIVASRGEDNLWSVRCCTNGKSSGAFGKVIPGGLSVSDTGRLAVPAAVEGNAVCVVA